VTGQGDLLWVKPAPGSDPNRVIFSERNSLHPDGEIWLLGSSQGCRAALTEQLAQALRDGVLIEVETPPGR
jgi:hypothetical protein